ncbi:MAG TPA: YceI family protein [Chthoniobacteraceae bacterium]|nr:YceI family protein [Chthoniobacteraceae bacterium]
MTYRNLSLLALCGALLTTSVVAAPESYEIDPAHTSIGFRIKHLFSSVTGRFNEINGSFTVDPQDPEKAEVKVTIPIASVDTGNEKRDGHLRTGDFFDAEKFKEMTFTSKSVKRTGENSAEITGDLSLHGVTKEVVLKTDFLGKGPGPDGVNRTGWKATTAIKRSDFGITYGKEIEGTPLIGDEVEIILDIEAIQKP